MLSSSLQGIGPAFAIPKVLKKAGLSQDDVDLWEINEAFASQAVMSIETLKIPYDKVNPNGGAIAFGHPLGATGARQVATAYAEAKRNGQKIFVTSMCIGSGMVSRENKRLWLRQRCADLDDCCRVWLPCSPTSSKAVLVLPASLGPRLPCL